MGISPSAVHDTLYHAFGPVIVTQLHTSYKTRGRYSYTLYALYIR